LANPEQQAALYFAPVRGAFLRGTPNRGDFDNQLSDTVYADSFIDYASSEGLSIDRATSLLSAPLCDAGCESFRSGPAIECAYHDHVVCKQVVDAWSMPNWVAGSKFGHDHFFATFDFVPSAREPLW
jgi:adenosine deaminase